VTWGEFKADVDAQMAAKGLSDDAELAFITERATYERPVVWRMHNHESVKVNDDGSEELRRVVGIGPYGQV
jgi:hypothetical protein